MRVPFDDGPYLDENSGSGKTLAASAVSGIGVTITAAGHSPFKPADVGRPIRLWPSGQPGWAVVTSYNFV